MFDILLTILSMSTAAKFSTYLTDNPIQVQTDKPYKVHLSDSTHTLGFTSSHIYILPL